MKIESSDQDIKTLLSSAYYKIPRFQRPYSWEKENIQEFWDDIIQDNTGDYFIGSMVVYNDTNDYVGIVDGQQRLTTITILLCVLRNTLDSLKHEDLAKGIHGLIERHNIDNKLEFILSTESSYRSIHETTYGKWSKQETKIEDAFNALMLFKVRQQTPCVLSLVRAYKKKNIKKKQLESALIAIEKFHFLFTALTSQRSSGGISSMYASIGRRLFTASDIQAAVVIIRELRTKLKDRVPKLEEVKALFPELIYTTNITKQKKIVKYVLVGFHRTANNNVATDFNSMTIEHLVPESLIGSGDFTDEIIGQIGNLLLVTENINNKLKNKSFKDKKKILISEGVNLPPEILAASDWTKNNITKMTQTLAEKAYTEIWKI